VTLPALIACDVDGTLIVDDETVTPRTRNAVCAAVDAGVQFVLATGRPPRWVQPVVDELGFAPMAVCANGAVIYDPATDRVVSARTLSIEILSGLAEIATRVIPGAGLAVERLGCAHDTATPQFVSSPGYEHAWLNPDNTEVSIEDLLSAPAVKLLIRKAGARSADMVAELAMHIGLLEGDITYSTSNGLIEIVPLGVSKATGIAEIARPQGITDDDMVAFGDMPNDVPMLLRAGHGVAMGNAHPDAVAAADEVTTPNTDDGVARVLERWWL
jgi:Cof subfamily protein (haloacid dehalogenase superfamily)